MLLGKPSICMGAEVMATLGAMRAALDGADAFMDGTGPVTDAFTVSPDALASDA